MSSESPVIAFIPVRGGSKGIPGKNIKPMAGKPLVWWSVNAAQESRSVDQVVVATDCDEIRSVVEGFGFDKVRVVGRSEETSTDTASSESVLIEFVQSIEGKALVVMMQATSPMVMAEDLDQAIATIRGNEADSLVSVVRQKRFLWDDQGSGLAVPANYDPVSRPRRQDFDGHLVENGAFYVMSSSGLLESGCRLHGRMAYHEMPEETYYEIDEPSDWRIVEGLLLERSRETKKQKPVKMFVTDVDGVLTDAGMYYTEKGDELKKFNTRDGMGMEKLRKAGIVVGIITSEDTDIVARRARKLKVDFVHQGIKGKLAVLQKECEERGLSFEEVAYIGDDINDLECLGEVGISFCPADAVSEVREVAQNICRSPGGGGCVREAAERLLEQSGSKPA